MAHLTRDQLENRLTDIHSALREAKRAIRTQSEAELVGQTVRIQRTLKAPISGDKHKMELEATITGLRWSYDDEMELKVTYTHPFTGKAVETEAPMY